MTFNILVSKSLPILRSRLGVPEVGAADRLQPAVEFVHQRDAVRDVEPDDVGVGDAVQVLL